MVVSTQRAGAAPRSVALALVVGLPYLVFSGNESRTHRAALRGRVGVIPSRGVLLSENSYSRHTGDSK